MTTSLFPSFINHSRSFHSLRSDETPIPLLNLPPLPTSPTSLLAPLMEPMMVQNRFLCPDINCDIKIPHTYVFQPHLLPPEGVHSIELSRFKTVPFPGSNIWTIEDEPAFLFRLQQDIYSELFGLMRLKYIGWHAREDREWAVFSGEEPDGGPRVALVYVPMEWTLFPVPDAPAWSFFTSLFSCFYSC